MSERTETTEGTVASPYKALFGWIEYQASFYPDNVMPFMPHMAYKMYYQHLQETDIDPGVYVSMAITSGGFARDSALPIKEVIEKNNEFGDQVRQLLQNNYGFAPQTVLVPSELGKVHEWSQADYLMFWFHTISGVNPDSARSIEKMMMSDGIFSPGKYASTAMNTTKGDERTISYREFTEKYVIALRESVSPFGKLFNMRAMLGMLDTDVSLGAKAEQLLAESIGIPYYHLFASEDSLPESIRPSVKILYGLGSTSIHLVEQEAESFSGILRPTPSSLPLRSTGLFKSQDIYDAKMRAPKFRVAY